MVLLVQSEDDKSHYAIEWESRGLYAVCKLGSWVDIGQLCRRAVLSRSRAQSSHSKSADVSSRNAAQERRVTAEEHIYGKRKRLAIEALQSVMKRPIKEVRPSSDGLASGGISSDIPEATSEEHIISTSVQNMLATGSAPVMEGNAQAGHIPGESATALTTTPQEIIPVTTTMEGAVSVSTAAEILENVRVQYFEALYLSKASLAYFAKGPLSRARASFHLDYDSALDMNDLISFLQSLILPIGVVDKKYKDAIPGLLSNYVAGSGDADDVQEHTGQPSKKTKTKKVKLCKDGLYTGEQDYIRKWWHSHSVSAGLSAPGQTQESLRRERISQLRTRETQLQMIVVLETLALQPLASNPADANESLPTIENGSTTPVTKPAPPRKSKKLPALNILLEMQADRLCIWQSVAAETDTTVSKGEKGESSAGRSEATAGRNGSRADMLRDFCVEVIMPFFSARLHEVCGMITLKLGGPVVVSPNSKTPARPSKSAGAAARPGSAAKRVISTKPARTLERVLTDDRLQRRGRSPAAAISLMRSATAPAIPGLKRERSEAPKLDSIPIADNVAINASRGGVLKSKKFSQREVDLGAMVAGADMRSKKPNIEAELKEAISALKRPNRQLAGQLMAESFERRAALASSNIRSTCNVPFHYVLFTNRRQNRNRPYEILLLRVSKYYPRPKPTVTKRLATTTILNQQQKPPLLTSRTQFDHRVSQEYPCLSLGRAHMRRYLLSILALRKLKYYPRLKATDIEIA